MIIKQVEALANQPQLAKYELQKIYLLIAMQTGLQY